MLISEVQVPGKHCRYRLFEWVATVMMLGVGVCLLVTPATVRSDPFRLMIEFGFSPLVLGVIFIVLGMLRCCALWLNGRVPVYGPRARALGALTGAVIWMQMLLSLVISALATGSVSIGIGLIAPLAFGDLISCYRAASDVRRAD